MTTLIAVKGPCYSDSVEDGRNLRRLICAFATGLCALRPIAVGEEVFLSYGEMPNRFLMAQFGFFLLPSHDPAELALNQPTVTLLASETAATITSGVSGGGGGGSGPDAISDAAVLEELCAAGLLARGEDGQCAVHQLGGPLLEAACARLRVDYGRLLDAQMRGAAPDDNCDLTATTLPPRQRLAIEYRQAQRQLLEREAARISSTTPHLSGL